MENKETRSIGYEDANVIISDNRTVVGYGIIFNKMSRLIENRFYEVILPEAIDGVLEKSDVYALMNHELSRGVLARSTYGVGSMKLQVDGKGVKYSFEAPSFDLGNELVEGIRRGDIRDSSFGFTVKQGGDKLERRGDGTYLRTISKFDTIVDMSPCYRGAYVDTTVALRSLDEFETINVDLPIEIETEPVTAETVTEPTVEVAEERTVSDNEHYIRCEIRKRKQITKKINYDNFRNSRREDFGSGCK